MCIFTSSSVAEWYNEGKKRLRKTYKQWGRERKWHNPEFRLKPQREEKNPIKGWPARPPSIPDCSTWFICPMCWGQDPICLFSGRRRCLHWALCLVRNCAVEFRKLLLLSGCRPVVPFFCPAYYELQWSYLCWSCGYSSHNVGWCRSGAIARCWWPFHALSSEFRMSGESGQYRLIYGIMCMCTCICLFSSLLVGVSCFCRIVCP